MLEPDPPVFGGEGVLRGNETRVALRTYALLSRRENSNVESWEVLMILDVETGWNTSSSE